jgi:hypothetical protein
MASLVRAGFSGRSGRYCLAGALGCGILLLGSATVRADETVETSPIAAEESAPQVDLDSLLKLPKSMRYDVERRGGATRGEWRERFVTLREELASERELLESSKLSLEKAASGADAWTFSPAGIGNVTDSPVDYQLREKIRRGEAEVARLEHSLRELEVEANLAGVPEDWRL